MSGPQPHRRSVARWVIFQTLARTTTPLSCAEISELTGLNTVTIQHALMRPRTAGWVTADWAPNPRTSDGRGAHRFVYTLTGRGRQALFEHLATPDKEG